jgi:HlyD family secretion protein
LRPETQEGATRYIAASVQQGDLLTSLSATGSLSARISVQVGSQLSGQISELLVDFNHVVTKGQVLARLDPRTFEAQVREAEAALRVAEARAALARAARERAVIGIEGAERQLVEAEAVADRVRVMQRNAERAYDRMERLQATLARATVEDAEAEVAAAGADLRAAEARTGVIQQAVFAARADLRSAEAEVENAKAAVAQQQAGLDQARLDLERTFIRSPIDGVVIGRDADVGRTVAASLESPTLFAIVEDLRKMHVFAAVDEADISRVRVGQDASFSVDAYPGLRFSAQVIEIRKAPRVAQGVVAYTVVFSADNPDELLMPGMTAVVQLITDRIAGALKVPNAALRFQPPDSDTLMLNNGAEGFAGQSETVWLLGADGVPAPVRIATGVTDGTATEVLDGVLRSGQNVIVGIADSPDARSWLRRLLSSFQV